MYSSLPLPKPVPAMDVLRALCSSLPCSFELSQPDRESCSGTLDAFAVVPLPLLPKILFEGPLQLRCALELLPVVPSDLFIIGRRVGIEAAMMTTLFSMATHMERFTNAPVYMLARTMDAVERTYK